MIERNEDIAYDVTGPATAPVSAEDLPQGTTLGRYVILKHLGGGGMGVVYLAFDNELERRVAIKMLRPEASARVSLGEARARLLREAQAMAKLAHPNVVAVFDVGTRGDEVFVAMEYVHGVTLRQWLAATTRSVRDILAVYVQAGRGLESAHVEGILHRDFKPENVVVDDRGRVRVLDFGLARFDRALTSDHATANEGGTDLALDATGVDHSEGLASPLTRAGAILGTPAYMAPEQLIGQEVDARTDQFSFCVALYEALCGEKPFDGHDIPSLASAIYAGAFKLPPGRRVPRRVERALRRGLSGAREKRFPSMRELLAELDHAMATPTRWAGAAAIGAAAVVATALVVARTAPARQCRGAEDALAGAWSAQRASDVASAFTATGSAHADEAFAHTRAILDGYAASWTAMHRDACEATRVRGEQSEEGLDLRMACLTQRKRELAANVDLFAHADAKTVGVAAVAASRLTPVETCVDIASLRAPFAPPRDEAERHAVEGVRRKVAEAESLVHVGRGKDADARAAEAVLDADRIGYEPARAEALLVRGQAQSHLGVETASETYLLAALAAERCRDDVVAATAWTGYVDDLARLHHFAEAAGYERVADAAVTRAGNDDAQRAKLLVVRSYVAYRRGALAEAQTLAEEAMKIPQPRRAAAREVLANVLWDEGKLDGALPLYRQAYEETARLFGETSEIALIALGDIGLGQAELGDGAGAVETLRRIAIEKEERLDLIPIHYSYLAQALVEAGREKEGLEAFAQASAKRDLTEDFAEEEADFARALVEREQDGAAASHAALALAGLAGAERQEQATEAMGVRALCEARGGDAAGAMADATRALEAKEKLFGERADLIPLLARGLALLALGRPPEAVRDLERALAIADGTRGDVAIRAEVRVALARALVAGASERERALGLATRGAEQLEAAGLGEAATRARQWVAANRGEARSVRSDPAP